MKWFWTGLVSLAAAVVILERLLGLAPVFLFLGALALGASVYFIWNSLTTVEGGDEMDFEEAMAFAVPTVAEEEKLAILRALKDLEYERAVGKISEADYQALVADYRAKAKASIQLADESLEKGRKLALEWMRQEQGQSAVPRKNKRKRGAAVANTPEPAEPADDARQGAPQALQADEAAPGSEPAPEPEANLSSAPTAQDLGRKGDA